MNTNLQARYEAAKAKAKADADQFAAECDARFQAMRDKLDRMMQEAQ